MIVRQYNTASDPKKSYEAFICDTPEELSDVLVALTRSAKSISFMDILANLHMGYVYDSDGNFIKEEDEFGNEIPVKIPFSTAFRLADEYRIVDGNILRGYKNGEDMSALLGRMTFQPHIYEFPTYDLFVELISRKVITSAYNIRNEGYVLDSTGSSYAHSILRLNNLVPA